MVAIAIAVGAVVASVTTMSTGVAPPSPLALPTPLLHPSHMMMGCAGIECSTGDVLIVIFFGT